MAGGRIGRRYGEACAASHALDLIGERWALLVVRELLLGPKRFGDLRSGVSGIGADVLSRRLRELEVYGVVRRRKLPPPAAVRVYELTDWGMELEPVIIALGKWGARSPLRPAEAPLGVDSLILSFRTMFDPGLSGDLDAVFSLAVGAEVFEVFEVRVSGGEFFVRRGEPTGFDARIEAGPAEIASVVYGERTLDDALASGEIRVRGSIATAGRFFGLFPLPEAAPV